jgi:hypothetical protein
MFADRTLAKIGTGVVFIGSVLTLTSSLLVPFPKHSQFVFESTSLVFVSILGVSLVYFRLFKALWSVIFLTVGIFIQCLISSLISGMDAPPSSIADSSIRNYIFNNSIANVAALFQHHLGWPVIFVGVSILSWVAWSVDGKFFSATELSNGAGMPILSPSATSVINELAEAPKWPLVYGTILILTGIIVLFAGTDISIARKLFGALISELGFAFFIAFIIGITIEIKTHAERDRQMSRGIISYIYGVNLDNELFLTTEEYVFKTPFYREDLEINYTFLRRRDGKFLLKYTIGYIVTNVGRHANDYAVHTFVEKEQKNNGERTAFPEIELGLQKIIIDGTELTADEITTARDAVADSRDYMQSSHTINIPPGESRRILGVHLMEKWERDAELWQSVNPCSGVSLVVNWAEDFNLDVKAGAVHAANTGNHPRNGFDSKSYDSNSLRAALIRPLFPFNGVYMWWKVVDLNEESELPPSEQVPKRNEAEQRATSVLPSPS